MLTWLEYLVGTRVFPSSANLDLLLPQIQFFFFLRSSSSADLNLLLLASPFSPNPSPWWAQWFLSLQLRRLSLQPLPRLAVAHLCNAPFGKRTIRGLCHFRCSNVAFFISTIHSQSLWAQLFLVYHTNINFPTQQDSIKVKQHSIELSQQNHKKTSITKTPSIKIMKNIYKNKLRNKKIKQQNHMNKKKRRKTKEEYPENNAKSPQVLNKETKSIPLRSFPKASHRRHQQSDQRVLRRHRRLLIFFRSNFL